MCQARMRGTLSSVPRPHEEQHESPARQGHSRMTDAENGHRRPSLFQSRRMLFISRGRLSSGKRVAHTSMSRRICTARSCLETRFIAGCLRSVSKTSENVLLGIAALHFELLLKLSHFLFQLLNFSVSLLRAVTPVVAIAALLDVGVVPVLAHGSSTNSMTSIRCAGKMTVFSSSVMQRTNPASMVMPRKSWVSYPRALLMVTLAVISCPSRCR